VACQLSIGISESITPAQRRRNRASRACAFTWPDRNRPPTEVPPPPSPRKYWTRREIAEWLVGRLSEKQPTLVGIDHGFSFPLRYFDEHHLPHDWPAFLDDFQRHWPTDDQYTYVDFVRDGLRGNGATRCGDTLWRRVTEVRAGAKSVFQFDVPGWVAKSTHAGLALATIYPLASAQRALLAFRWLACAGGAISRGRSLSISLEPQLRAGESE
jgi:hypothetical protein